FYEGTFTPTTVAVQGGGTVQAQTFNVAGAPATWLEPVRIPTGSTSFIDLQWDQPFLTGDGAGNGTGSLNSLDFELFTWNGVTLTRVAQGGVDELGRDPVQVGQFANPTGTSSLYLAVFQNDPNGPTPGTFKIIIDDNSTNPVSFSPSNGGIGSETMIGHEE